MRSILLVLVCFWSSTAKAAPSCAGPADPTLTTAKVSLMLGGDDDYPIDEMRKLSPGVVPALVEIVRTGKDSYVRSRAISILGDLGCRETAKAVEDALKDPNPTIRLPATGAIGKLHADPTPILTGVLGDRDNGVVKFTIKALGQFGDKRAIAPLDKLRTTHAETWLRDLAKTALSDIRKRHP